MRISMEWPLDNCWTKATAMEMWQLRLDWLPACFVAWRQIIQILGWVLNLSEPFALVVDWLQYSICWYIQLFTLFQRSIFHCLPHPTPICKSLKFPFKDLLGETKQEWYEHPQPQFHTLHFWQKILGKLKWNRLFNFSMKNHSRKCCTFHPWLLYLYSEKIPIASNHFISRNIHFNLWWKLESSFLWYVMLKCTIKDTHLCWASNLIIVTFARFSNFDLSCYS